MFSTIEKVMLAIAALFGVFCIVMAVRKFRAAISLQSTILDEQIDRIAYQDGLV